MENTKVYPILITQDHFFNTYLFLGISFWLSSNIRRLEQHLDRPEEIKEECFFFLIQQCVKSYK